MEGMKFTSKNLDDLINKVKEKKNEKYDMSSEKMMRFSQIIQGVARKYSFSDGRLNWIEQEDLEQDLWERVLRLIDDCGGIENTDEDLVAKICWNTAVDKYRYHRRRYDSKAQYIEGSDVDDDTSCEYFERVHTDAFVKGIDLVFYKEVIDRFKIGSKERKYVVMKLVNSGLVDVNMLDPWDREIAEIPETEDEEGYIHALGYKSHCPGSWTVKKRNIRIEIREFIGC